ncbi:MAG TPA: FtsX-like permease family protein [Flavitalea sp.]|nr:FtsX-like permease family protein [Flavitalea sp.]
MIKHWLLIAFRNMKKFKTSFLINFIGLSSGLACALFIYLWVNDELQFDKFHKYDSQLYQVMELSKENGMMMVHDGTQGLLADAMAKDLPEVERAVSVTNTQRFGKLDLITPDKTLKATPSFAGKDFFNMFSFPLLQGNPSSVMNDRNAIVISNAIAKSLFGSSSEAVGKSINYEMFGKKHQTFVSGVFDDLPANSSMKFDFVLTHDVLINEIVPNLQKWGNTGPVTYLQVKKGTDTKQFDKKIKNFLTRYDQDTFLTLFVRSYSSSYLYGNYENGIQTGGRIEYVKLFIIIAFIILIVACINFMNLSTARASRRLKEVGIKKAVGSTRRSLVFQFLSEAMLMVLISLVAACLIVAIFLSSFNNLTGKQIGFHVEANLILLLVCATLITGVISGSYPAFYLSGFNPVAVLKGRPKNSLSELIARKGLVVFQFSVSLVLIISVIVVYRQMEYVQLKNLGYNKASAISFDKIGAIGKNTDLFLDQLKNIPGVLNASTIQQKLAQDGNGSSTYDISWPGKPDNLEVDIAVRAVDYDLIETLGIQIKEGRSFSRAFGSDSTKLIFNETAIKIMGLKKPLGTPINMWGRDMSIAGVVKDFHISSFHEPIAPVVFMYRPANTAVVIARISPRTEKETISKIEKLFKKFNPENVFEYSFLDDEYQAQYVSEQRVSVISRYFAGLGILIMCLGLFGLATFNAEVRTKEIGIRKVLGATTSAVVLLLSRDFFKLVFIAMLVGFPLAWFVMNKWLSGFEYKITIGPEMFVIAIIAIVAITLITISYQSIKAAVANPAKSLKSE